MSDRRAGVILSLLAACVVLLATHAAHAETATAILQNVTGTPSIFELGNGAPRHTSYAVAGRSYTLPIEVETGAADAATFVLPNSVIEVSASTLMRIVAPENNGSGIVQRVLQQGGSSLFRVHRGTLDRFQVETPFLVSVVKGTVFNVLVQDDGATVSLQEGRLQVNSIDAHQSVELAPGDVAFAGRDGVLHLLEVQLTDAGTTARGAVAPTVSSGGSDGSVPGIAVRPTDVVATTVQSVGSTTASVASTVASVAGPVASNVVAPVANTVATNVVAPVAANVVAPVVTSVAANVVTPVVTNVVTPVVETVAQPVVDNVVAPAVTTVVAPVVTSVVQPVVNTVAPVVAQVAVPVVTSVVAPVAAPVVATVVPVVAPVVAPIVPVVAPVVAPVVTDVASPVTGALTGLLGSRH